MSTALSVINSKTVLSPEDLEILRNTKFRTFTPAEIAYCAKVVGQLSLSPFLNQIHFTKRKNKDGTYSIVTQIGIDGFRLTAQRAGGYAGSDEAVFEYDDKDNRKEQPLKATVTVYKIVQGVRCAFTASARWDEYYPGSGPNSFMWEKMPHNQLAKCAEALALRKAFPAELSSIYAEEEMHQADRTNGLPVIAPEQPDEGDGIQTESYVIPYGPLAKQPIEKADPARLRAYIEEIEQKAKKLNKPIPNWAQELIRHAEPLIAEYENALETAEPGWGE